ncbi:MAG: autotransporter outer membrane beta-barrel domain-containing protein [Gemmataceae bacterium]
MFKVNVRKLFRKTFGSWQSATPPRRKPRATVKPSLEALEDRWLPSGIVPDGGGGVGQTTDTLIWKPTNGNSANNVQNWYDSTAGKQGIMLPGTGNPTYLDGSVSNSAIQVNGTLQVKFLNVVNNYNNTMTINSGNIEACGSSDSIQNGSTLTVVSYTPGGLTLADGLSFFVFSGATLNLSDPAGAYAGGTFITCPDVNRGGILSDAGTVNWNGTAVSSGNNAIVDSIGLPVLVTGTFNADGGTKGVSSSLGGQLQVKGQDAKTANVGFQMTGGQVNLKNGAFLIVPLNYNQTGGALSSDNSLCTLQTGTDNNGDINIAGGSVTVDTVANTVNALVFTANTVELNGTLNVNGLTLGGMSLQADLLNCGSATVTLQSNSKLVVSTTGTGSLGGGNQWTVMGYGSIKGSWGSPPTVPAGMTASTGPTKVLISN